MREPRSLLSIVLAIGSLAVAASATAQTTLPHPGRLLASNCFQCHGTNGRGGYESLAGKSAREIFNELLEMRAKAAGSNIMVPHASGYTDEQLRLIADYFSRVPR